MADVDLMQAHMAALLANSERRQTHADQRSDRHTDTALHGLKVVEAISAYELLVSNDPQMFGLTNAGVRVPTTLDHPGIPATKS